MAVNPNLCNLLLAFAIGYLPGALLGLVLWLWGKRSSAMPLFRADLISFAAPIIVWAVMYRYDWTLVSKPHRDADELVILGWIWSLCVAARLLIPRYTNKLRFRLAAIHIGSIGIIAAVLLALFYSFSWK